MNHLKKGELYRILEAHNGISAKIADQAGFDGIWESSLTDSGSKCLPDTELVSGDSRLATIREIREATSLPIIVDWDTGGQVEHFPCWVKRLEKAGVDAIVIEDKAFPKRNSLDKNAKHNLEDVDKFCEKISEGKKSAQDLWIIARLESLIAKHSMYEALIRAEAFVEAGADGLMIHSKEKVGDEEVLEFARRFRERYEDVPLMAVPTAYNHIYDEQLKEAGFNIVCHANQMLRASIKIMQHVAESIYNYGRSVEMDNEIASVKEIFKLTGYEKR